MLTPFPDVAGFEILEQSFNFSSLQNLREVNFGITVNWSEGALPWIHMALSTLRSATSPHLSTIRLDFGHSYIPDRSIEPMTQDMGNDLRRIADEVTRIESEFDGAVDLTVVSDPGFAVVLDTLNVRFYFCGVGSLHNIVGSDAFPFTPRRSFSHTAIEMGSTMLHIQNSR